MCWGKKDGRVAEPEKDQQETIWNGSSSSTLCGLYFIYCIVHAENLRSVAFIIYCIECLRPMKRKKEKSSNLEPKPAWLSLVTEHLLHWINYISDNEQTRQIMSLQSAIARDNGKDWQNGPCLLHCVSLTNQRRATPSQACIWLHWTIFFSLFIDFAFCFFLGEKGLCIADETHPTGSNVATDISLHVLDNLSMERNSERENLCECTCAYACSCVCESMCVCVCVCVRVCRYIFIISLILWIWLVRGVVVPSPFWHVHTMWRSEVISFVKILYFIAFCRHFVVGRK